MIKAVGCSKYKFNKAGNKIIKLYLNLALIYINGNALTKVKQFMEINVIIYLI